MLLVNPDGLKIPALKVEDIYPPNLSEEAKKVFGVDGEIQPGMKVLNILGTEKRALLHAGKPLQDWLTFPEIMQEPQEEFVGRYSKSDTSHRT